MLKSPIMLKILGTVLVLALSPVSHAQHGHPLAGIWLGDWGANAENRNFVVMELIWTNTTLSGTINAGFPDQAVIDEDESALDSSDWTVHLEAVSEDESGNTVRTVIDGELENLGSANRSMSGTWRRGNVNGNFSLTRE